MPTDYDTIRQQILKTLRDAQQNLTEVPNILKSLDACIYSLTRVPALLVERFVTNRRVTDLTLEEQTWQLQEECRELQDATAYLAVQVEAAERHFKAIVRSDNFDVIHVDQLEVGTVGRLLAVPRIYKNVKTLGPRLLVVRPRNRKALGASDNVYGLQSGCSFTICENEEQLVASLLQSDAWLFIFGCGSGFVTDQCLYVYSPMARAVMPVTVAMANVLKGNVERMAKEQWARKWVDGMRVWQPRELT